MKPAFVAYNITQNASGKNRWNPVGVAFENKDSSINVKLNSLPVGGQIQLRVPQERTETPPAEQAQPEKFLPDFTDDIPF